MKPDPKDWIDFLLTLSGLSFVLAIFALIGAMLAGVQL